MPTKASVAAACRSCFQRRRSRRKREQLRRAKQFPAAGKSGIRSRRRLSIPGSSASPCCCGRVQLTALARTVPTKPIQRRLFRRRADRLPCAGGRRFFVWLRWRRRCSRKHLFHSLSVCCSFCGCHRRRPDNLCAPQVARLPSLVSSS